jgi:hypothetical protein
MKRLIEEVTKIRYKVSIPGMTDKLPDEYRFAHATSPEGAMAGLVKRICQAVQNGETADKNWNFTDTGFKALMSPQYAALIIKHLGQTKKWKAEEI